MAGATVVAKAVLPDIARRPSRRLGTAVRAPGCRPISLINKGVSLVAAREFVVVGSPPSNLSRAPVAQLDRVPGYEPGGREFESLRARHIEMKRPPVGGLFISIRCTRISIPSAHGQYKVVVGCSTTRSQRPGQAPPVTPSWTDSRPRIWSRAQLGIARGIAGNNLSGPLVPPPSDLRARMASTRLWSGVRQLGHSGQGKRRRSARVGQIRVRESGPERSSGLPAVSRATISPGLRRTASDRPSATLYCLFGLGPSLRCPLGGGDGRLGCSDLWLCSARG
jgi:hypothetical protein